MCSACRLIVIYICVKFGENVSDGIRVMERTQMMEALTDGRTDVRTKWVLCNFLYSQLMVMRHFLCDPSHKTKMCHVTLT